MSKYSLMIEADTAEDLSVAIARLNQQLSHKQTSAPVVAPPVPPPIAPSDLDATASVPVEVEEKSVISASALRAEKPAKKAKKEKPAEKPAADADIDPFSEEEEKQETKKYTFDDVKAALQSVVDANGETGMATAKGIMNEFGAARISAVKEAQYPDFIAACQKAAKA